MSKRIWDAFSRKRKWCANYVNKHLSIALIEKLRMNGRNAQNLKRRCYGKGPGQEGAPGTIPTSYRQHLTSSFTINRFRLTTIKYLASEHLDHSRRYWPVGLISTNIKIWTSFRNLLTMKSSFRTKPKRNTPIVKSDDTSNQSQKWKLDLDSFVLCKLININESEIWQKSAVVQHFVNLVRTTKPTQKRDAHSEFMVKWHGWADQHYR